jgi:hypothetical protein
MKTTFYKVKRLGFAALAALALLVMGCENPTVWDENAQARSVGVGSATIGPVCVKGTLYTVIDPVEVVITLTGNEFDSSLLVGTDVSAWFTNLPEELVATVSANNGSTVTITITGRPKTVSSFWIDVTIPASVLVDDTDPITVTAVNTAVYDIRWPYPNWEHSEVFPDGAVNAAAYGEGVFVVGNRNAGEVAYSLDNARTWTIVEVWDTGSPEDWVSIIAYIDGTFYAGGNFGKFASSANGKTWTTFTNTLLNEEDIRAIAYGCGTTVIGGTNGQAERIDGYPADTLNWTQVKIFGTTDTINSIAFGADTGGTPLFVVTAQGGHSAYSYGGGTIWQDTSSQTQAIFTGTSTSQTSIKQVAYDPKNHKFVAVGYHKTAYVVPTPASNGFIWTGVDVADIMGNSNRTSWLNCVTFGGKYFIAGGSGGQSISSLDGINWAVTGAKGQFPVPTTDIPFVNAIAYGGDEQSPLFLIGGGFDAGPGITAYNLVRFKDGKIVTER